ncbi:hypothetical protein D9757_000756 [Collybiopsis confluens]|uniref:SCD domain-containing protein n=1 Tax=Collybiopsis confluens TaxID=2823264 RepID=A0A8H5MH31_9AGAR|nr:hypothetical protein D9757_000756 [Collybiopsis confluens]
MSSNSSPTAPRRSQRDKKQARPITTFTEPTATSRKRKHAETDSEEPAPINGLATKYREGDGEDTEVSQDDEDENEKKPTKRTKNQSVKKLGATASATRKPRKPRVPKDSLAMKSNKRATNARSAPFDPAAFTKSTNISSDNPLFNAVINPNAALQGIIEDFLESLNQDENRALAELMNMIFRCCACNETIDGDTAVDYDGVVDRLEDLTEEVKKTTSPAGTYPLISKAPPFHNPRSKSSFRANLSDFFSRLINSAALLGSLYDSPLVWLVPMTQSQLRAIRHTTTVVALEVEAALCQVAKEVEKEVELTGRMKEGERKRARTKSIAGSSAKNKEKELQAKLKEIKARQDTLLELIKESADRSARSLASTQVDYLPLYTFSVFIHRYRDLDPIIRAECISSLSSFFEILPSHFCTNSDYFRYVGWVLSDEASTVRLAAIRALQVVYEGAGAGNSSKKKDGSGVILPTLRHFTTRFLPRMLQISRFDVDIGVRVAIMHVLGCVDELALLPEQDRIRLGTLVFSDEPRIRKAVARFVTGALDEWVQEKISAIDVQPSNQAIKGRSRGRGSAGTAGRSTSVKDVDSDKIGIKALVHLLVKWGNVLDRERRKDPNNEGNGEEEEETGTAEVSLIDGDTSAGEARGIAPTLLTAVKKSEAVTRGRIGLAVEALWDEIDVVRDWEGMLDMLVLDHSASGENDSSNKVRSARTAKKSAKKRRGAELPVNGDAEEHEGSGDDDDDNTSTSTRVDSSWRLTETEEGALLEALVASLRKTKKHDETTSEPITQSLIEALPRLFIKYQTDENRIIDVLTLPTLMNLEVYLEMRETNAYISLWSDVAKQFLTHTSSYVIATAVQTMISHLLANTAMSNINSEQILELEDELSISLRDTVAGPMSPTSSPAGRDIEICLLTEDEALTLTSAIHRLRTLAQHRDMTFWMEEDEGGKRSSAWDILSAISERARLSLEGESEMLVQCLQLMALHIMWKSRRLLCGAGVDSSPEEAKDREDLLDQRNIVLDKFVEFAVGTQVQGNGIVESVKRTAFKNLLNLHVLFSSIIENSNDEGANDSLVMDDEVQWRCAGFIQAEVLRYAEIYIEDARSETDDDEDEDEDDANDEDVDHENRNSKKKTKSKHDADPEEEDHEAKPDSRSHLELEYVFIDVISTFLRAIRVGVIQVRHGDVLLAHFGRLGSAFDACTKVVVDVLKDQGFSDDNGQLVVRVTAQTMKEAFNVFKKTKSNDESSLVAVAKLLSSCFVIRGSQLTILRRLESRDIVEIHTTLITWITKQIGSHLKSTNQDRRTALIFFRALVPLVVNVQGRDALKIKAHLDQSWVHAKIEPGITKMWEPLRAYERRLGKAMGKDKSSLPKGARKQKKDRHGVSTDTEESEVEKPVDDDQEIQVVENARSPPPRPRPRLHRAAATKNLPAPPNSDTEADAATPEIWKHPATVYKSKSILSPGKTPSQPPDSNPPSSVNTGKRPRTDENEDDQDLEDARFPSHKRTRRDDKETSEPSEDFVPNTNEDGPSLRAVSEAREMTPAADIQIRRKRVRH